MDKLKLIKKETEKLLATLEVEAKVEVDEEDRNLNVRLETPDTGLLIGYHGETLQALQLILNLVLAKKAGEYLKIIVHVGDYREKRNSYLESLAHEIAERVSSSGQEEIMPPMSSFERRLIHLSLADHPSVKTESTGENRERRIVVKPK